MSSLRRLRNFSITPISIEPPRSHYLSLEKDALSTILRPHTFLTHQGPWSAHVCNHH